MKRDLSAKTRRGQAGSLVSVIAWLGFAAASSRAGVGLAEGTLLTASDPTAVTGEPEDLIEDEPEAAPAPPPLSLCQTDLRLSGTFYDARTPQRSFASFHVRADRPGGEVYKVGERVGAFALLSIGPRTVVLDDGGAGCYLKLAGASVPPPAAPAKRAKRKRAPKAEKKPEQKVEEKADFTPEELNASIRALGGDKYEVKKELLPKIVQRSAQLRNTTQWTSVRGYSSVLGLRIEKLASEGLLERLGLRTGDMVKTLNGLQLTSLEGALEAQKLISSAPHLSLLIQRDGTPVTLEYKIVP